MTERKKIVEDQFSRFFTEQKDYKSFEEMDLETSLGYYKSLPFKGSDRGRVIHAIIRKKISSETSLEVLLEAILISEKENLPFSNLLEETWVKQFKEKLPTSKDKEFLGELYVILTKKKITELPRDIAVVMKNHKHLLEKIFL